MAYGGGSYNRTRAVYEMKASSCAHVLGQVGLEVIDIQRLDRFLNPDAALAHTQGPC